MYAAVYDQYLMLPGIDYHRIIYEQAIWAEWSMQTNKVCLQFQAASLVP